MTGQTSSLNFSTTAGAFQTTFGGAQDAFVTKLNQAGSALVYSTFLGGSGSEAGQGIAMDMIGRANVTGSVTSSNFPVTADATQATIGGGGDAFVTKLNRNGSALRFSTFLGGGGSDVGESIAVGPGKIYVTGNSDSSNFPTMPGAFQEANAGSTDGFVVKYKLND